MDSVQVCCGVQLPLRRVGQSDIWAVAVEIDRLSEAVISYGFYPELRGRLAGSPGKVQATRVWRGPQAPAAPVRADSLLGQISEYVLESRSLSQARDISAYLPPGHNATQSYPVVYAADGEAVSQLAMVLDPQIASGSLPPIIVVGVHSAAGGEPEADGRSREYLPRIDPQRFAAHEDFFVREVSAWAEQTLGASPRREDRAIFGFSNGGAFAVSMGIRHPDHYGTVLAFSMAIGPAGLEVPAWTPGLAPRHYLLAGTLEPFLETTSGWAATLSTLGVEHVLRVRVSGHDPTMWEEEFPVAVAWAFTGR